MLGGAVPAAGLPLAVLLPRCFIVVNYGTKEFVIMNFAYHAIYAVCCLVSLLPLRVLYCLSDVLFFIVYHVVKYRRPLVRKNLTDSFPDKTAEWVAGVERAFYAWLCDYFVETLKLLTISKRQISRRMRFVGHEQLSERLRQGKTCSLYLGHYCNWEWITSLPLLVDEGICSQICSSSASGAVSAVRT